MAKKIKFTPVQNKAQREMDASFSEALESLPLEMKKNVEQLGIQCFDDFIDHLLANGIDPVKLAYHSVKQKSKLDGFDLKDMMLPDNFLDDEEDDFDDEEEDFYDEEEDFDDEEEGGNYEEVDEEYLLGLKLPEKKFIGKPKREFHIRIKLNNAPVKIWRELVVPSNITLELLAYVLIDAMGWEHEHLYQFIGKGDVYYMNTAQLKEEKKGFMAFFYRVEYRNSDKTTLEMVLQPKGKRIRFEYDFGDSWMHDLWVKAARDYAPDEEPAIRLLKGQGACPPEDCGGVWGYAELLEMNKKARKTADEKEQLEWYDIPKGYDPDDCDLEWLQEDVEDLWKRIKEE